ncbi:hypothetical protein [Shewanella gaetbuli]|uniref:Uncharacterized protein n=1 Tax=Shewanella gaetbuli TaxID=220752 RepID=A0A9X2CLS0_9GAMM|nr:hypothetical protein [Shewanella gaetbuli]MCL1142895.1 hypothetical protein [Shewanella gaetbuli]
MSLDSIYAMLNKPVQAVNPKKRNVAPVTTTSNIAADSHEEHTAFETTQSKNSKTDIKQKSKSDYQLGSGDYVTDDDAPITDNSAPKKHIDVEI